MVPLGPQGNWCRSVPYSLDELKDTALVYTDAESNGFVATVILATSIRVCYHGKVCSHVKLTR